MNHQHCETKWLSFLTEFSDMEAQHASSIIFGFGSSSFQILFCCWLVRGTEGLVSVKLPRSQCWLTNHWHCFSIDAIEKYLFPHGEFFKSNQTRTLAVVIQSITKFYWLIILFYFITFNCIYLYIFVIYFYLLSFYFIIYYLLLFYNDGMYHYKLIINSIYLLYSWMTEIWMQKIMFSTWSLAWMKQLTALAWHCQSYRQYPQDLNFFVSCPSIFQRLSCP